MKNFNVLKLFFIFSMFFSQLFSMQSPFYKQEDILESCFLKGEYCDDEFGYDESVLKSSDYFLEDYNHEELIFLSNLKTQALLTIFIVMGIKFDIDEAGFCFENSFKYKELDNFFKNPKNRVLLICGKINEIIDYNLENLKSNYEELLKSSSYELFELNIILRDSILGFDFLKFKNYPSLEIYLLDTLGDNFACLSYLFDLVKELSIMNLRKDSYIEFINKFKINTDEFNTFVNYIENNKDLSFCFIYEELCQYIYNNLYYSLYRI